MKREIFLDLDGTLLNTSERHYRAFIDVLSHLKLRNVLSKEDFWNMKRTGKKTIYLLPVKNPRDYNRQFSEEWLKCLEKKAYLKLDELFRGSTDVLSILKPEFDLVLLTMRQNVKNLFSGNRSVQMEITIFLERHEVHSHNPPDSLVAGIQ